MRKSNVLLIGILATACLAVLLALIYRNDAGTRETRSPVVEIRRINPPSEAGDVIECQSAQFVDLQYEVRNRGKQPIRGARLDGSSCSCEITAAPPDEIPAGATARIGFRLRAPPYGTISKNLKLLDESGETIATFSAALRVEFQPPALTRPFEDLHVSFVKEDSSPREIHLTAIEEKNAPHWITGLVSTPEDLVRVLALKIDERPQPDQTLIQRIYRFQLACPSIALGRHTGTVTLQTRSAPPATSEKATLTVDVLDQASVIPDRIVVSTNEIAQPESRRVVLVHRLREGEILPPKFDEDLLSVRAVKGLEGRAVSFEVSSRTGEPCETKVLFPLKNGQTKELAVRIQKPSTGKRK